MEEKNLLREQLRFEHRIASLETQVTHLSSQMLDIKELHKSLNNLNLTLGITIEHINVQNEKISELNRKLDTLESSVKTILGKGGKQYDLIIHTVIIVVVSTLVTIMFGAIAHPPI